jgi:hypothetical protein
MALDRHATGPTLVARRPAEVADVHAKVPRPQVVKYGPESLTPIGQGKSWPGWAWLLALVLLILFVMWTQGWLPVPF